MSQEDERVPRDRPHDDLGAAAPDRLPLGGRRLPGGQRQLRLARGQARIALVGAGMPDALGQAADGGPSAAPRSGPRGSACVGASDSLREASYGAGVSVRRRVGSKSEVRAPLDARLGQPAGHQYPERLGGGGAVHHGVFLGGEPEIAPHAAHQQ